MASEVDRLFDRSFVVEEALNISREISSVVVYIRSKRLREKRSCEPFCIYFMIIIIYGNLLYLSI